MMSEADPAARSAAKKTRTIVLWGGSQVGKTTTLAAYLGKYRPKWIQRKTEASRKTIGAFLEVWSKLRNNRWARGTQEARSFELLHQEGLSLSFRDMRGGNASVVWDSEEDSEALESADAAMLFVEWPDPTTAHRLHAALDALQVVSRDCPAALVITKCEAFWSPEDFPLFALDPFDHIGDQEFPQDLADLMEEFAEHCSDGAVFPITVYGWYEGLPANFYDEFGRQVPWNIRPSYVERPFEYIIDRLVERG
jgi:hypothetical protein